MNEFVVFNKQKNRIHTEGNHNCSIKSLAAFFKSFSYKPICTTTQPSRSFKNYALKFFTQPSTQVEGSSLNITFYCLSSIRSRHNFPEFQYQLAFPSSFSNDHFYKSYFPRQSFRPNIFTVFSFQHLATKLPSSSPLIYFYFWSHYFLLCFVSHKDMARSNGHNERFNGRVTVKI